jgi:nicotinamidase-related amidase
MARVWDRFLTEQDKAHLAQSRDRRVGFGSRPAVLNIDIYRGVFGDREMPLLEGVKLWPSYCGPVGWKTIPHVQTLLREARAKGIPVFHATGLPEEESGIPSWSDAIHGGGGPRRITGADQAAKDRHARRFDIIDEAAPLPGEYVVRKTSPSAFQGTSLLSQLIHLRIDTLLVTGESTSGCVRATVVDGATHRFRVQVVEDCVFDRHEACHAINLFDMNQKYADVTPIDSVVAYLRGLNNAAGPGRESASN